MFKNVVFAWCFFCIRKSLGVWERFGKIIPTSKDEANSSLWGSASFFSIWFYLRLKRWKMECSGINLRWGVRESILLHWNLLKLGGAFDARAVKRGCEALFKVVAFSELVFQVIHALWWHWAFVQAFWCAEVFWNAFTELLVCCICWFLVQVAFCSGDSVKRCIWAFDSRVCWFLELHIPGRLSNMSFWLNCLNS